MGNWFCAIKGSPYNGEWGCTGSVISSVLLRICFYLTLIQNIQILLQLLHPGLFAGLTSAGPLSEFELQHTKWLSNRNFSSTTSLEFISNESIESKQSTKKKNRRKGGPVKILLVLIKYMCIKIDLKSKITLFQWGYYRTQCRLLQVSVLLEVWI